MCFTIFTRAPLRPGWYHVCPFHICTRTLRVKEKRRISLRTSQGVEPNVERPQHPQASEFLWSTPLWNRTNETWNQQLHHDRKNTPQGKILSQSKHPDLFPSCTSGIMGPRQSQFEALLRWKMSISRRGSSYAKRTQFNQSGWKQYLL